MKNRIGIWVAFSFLLFCLKSYAQPTGNEDRWYWVNTMVKIANPVLDNLSQETKKKKGLTKEFPLFSALLIRFSNPQNHSSEMILFLRT